MICFDHNATAPLHPIACEAWLKACAEWPGNPSSTHRLGQRARRALNQAREDLARMLGCSPLDLVFTSGATESNNALLRQLHAIVPSGATVWLSALEHPSLLVPCQRLFGDSLRLIPVTSAGVVDLNWMRREVGGGKPGFVAVMAANNETGVLQPWREVLSFSLKLGVPFVCDATQWIGRMPCAGLGDCHFLSGSAHKFGGPKGVGFLKLPENCRPDPLLRGGPQQFGHRAGTENLPGIHAAVALLRFLEDQCLRQPADPTLLRDETTRPFSKQLVQRQEWNRRFAQLLFSTLPGARVLGASADRLWNTLQVILPPLPGEGRWLTRIDKAGFAVSGGSACASGRQGLSHVLAAMGIAESEAARVVRFSSGWETTWEEWESLLQALSTVYSQPIPPQRPSRPQTEEPDASALCGL